MRNDYNYIENAVVERHSAIEIDGLTQRSERGYVEMKLAHIEACLSVFQ